MRRCTRRFTSLPNSRSPLRSCPSKATMPTSIGRSASSRSAPMRTLWSTTAPTWNRTSFGWLCSSVNLDQHWTSCKNKNKHSSNCSKKWKLDRFYFRIYFKSFRIFTQEQKDPPRHQSRQYPPPPFRHRQISRFRGFHRNAQFPIRQEHRFSFI
jgi:hypothetical protein